MALTQPRILLTGATGFIGGSVLARLVTSDVASIRAASITCLVRGADRAAKLTAVYGDRVKPVIYNDLNDLETTTAVAAEHDVVISTTPGFLPAPARALQEGLAKRKRTQHLRSDGDGDGEPWFIHTSGTSNVGSRPVSGAWLDDGSLQGRVFDDAVDDLYEYQAARNAVEPYIQRTAEKAVVDAGLEFDVRTLVVMAPTVYGTGSGLFNKHSTQIPAYVSVALDRGRAAVIGDGKGSWDHVHVDDLAALYELIAAKALNEKGQGLPWGKKGIIFAGHGRHTWGGIASGVARACVEAGVLSGDAATVDHLGLAEATKVFAESYLGEEDETMVELGLASSARTIPTAALGLGWKPVRGEEAWERGFREEVDAVVAERRGKGR